MTCRTCKQWAATSFAQHRARQKKIVQNPEVGVATCPQCGGTDWVTTTNFIKKPSEIKTALAWGGLCLALAVLFVIVFNVTKANSEICLDKIDNNIERKGGYRWQWRTVDGRKCWYYSNTLLPKEDLVWSYNSEDFDSDVRVIERKFYFPEKSAEQPK